MALEALQRLIDAVLKEVGEVSGTSDAVTTAREHLAAANAELSTAQEAAGAEKGQAVAAIDAIDPETRFGGRTPDAMYMTDLLQHLIDSGIAVHAVPVEGGWLEVDTVDDLDRFEELHTRGLLDTRFDPLRD